MIIKKIAFKNGDKLLKTSFHKTENTLTSLREEIARLQTIEDRLEVKVVQVLPETLDENVLYVVSDEKVVDVKSMLSRLGGHDLDIQVINTDLEELATDLETAKTEINSRIDDTSEVIGLKTSELNAKIASMEEDIGLFKEKMNEQKTDFTANIVQLQDLTAKHTNDIKTNADNITALEAKHDEEQAANLEEIAAIKAKDVEQDNTIAELTGKGSGLSILDLKDTVQENVNKLRNHETRVTKLETDTTAHKESYDAYVTANDKRVKDLEDLEASHNEAVNTRIDGTNNTIETNRNEFLNTQDRNEEKFEDHETRITKNTTDIATLNEEMQSSNAALLQTLEEKIDTGLANEAEVRAKADTNLQDSVNEINLTDKNQNARLKALEDYTQNDFTSEIQNLKDRATALENEDISLARKVQAIQQFSANHDSRLENLELNDHSYYNQRITALENTTKNQKNRLDGIDTLNITQNNRLTAIETKNTEQDTILGTHNDRITDLEEHRENLEAESRQIARDELDTKLQELEDNYHDEMMSKVENMTSTELSELETDYNNFKDTVDNDISTFKTQTNNSIQTFQGTLDTTLELVEDTQTEIKNTQAEQKTFLEEKTQAITDAQLVQDHYNQSYWEKFLRADEYNKELAEQQRLDKVNVYATNPNFSEEVVDTVTEYETVTEEIPEEERDPEHPEITTREVQKEVQRDVTHTVEHSQLNNSVALYEVESPDVEQTEFDLSDLQGRVQALEETKDDYKAAIQEVEEKFNNFDDQTAKIEELEGKLQSTKSQLGGLGNLHAGTVERVNNLERYATLNDQKFNNYKTTQAEINTRQDDDLQSLHDYFDTNVEDLYKNYDKLQTQNQDDVVVLRKVVDTPATEDTEETSHLELDSTEIIKVDDLVDTKEELLRVRDLPVKDHKETYLRGETSENIFAYNNTLRDYYEDGKIITKESYYNYNLDVEDAKNIIVSKSDNGLQRLEVRKTFVEETREIPSEVEGEDPTTETVTVPKYTLWYVQTDEYINEETQETYTEDTEIKITDIDPSDYVETDYDVQDAIKFMKYGKWDIHFAFSNPISYWSGSGDVLSYVQLFGNGNGSPLTYKGASQNDSTKFVGVGTANGQDVNLTITADSCYSSDYKVSKSWANGPSHWVWLSGGGTGHSVRYVADNMSLEKLVFQNTEQAHNTYYNRNIVVTIKYNDTEVFQQNIELTRRSRVTIDVLNGFNIKVEGV